MSFDTSSQTFKCECGLPGVRLRPDFATQPNGRAYYKCIPCNRVLGFCPCTTPGARTTLTCSCNDEASDSGSDAGSMGAEEHVPRGVSVVSAKTFNPHNPNPGFDEDWESNCTPGFMVSRFKARGQELPPWH